MSRRHRVRGASGFARDGSTVAAWLVLGCALATTAVVWWHARHDVRGRTREQLDRYVERFTEALRRRLSEHETVLRATSAMVAGRDALTADDWRRFVDQLDLRHPRIRALQAVVRVPADDLARHVAAMRAEGHPDYAVHPLGDRPEYFPIVFAAPIPSGAATLGFDVMADRARHGAAEHARDTGEPAVTGQVGMPGDPSFAGFVLFQACYRSLPASPTTAERRRALAGFVSETFSLREIVHDLVPARPGMRVLVIDASGPEEVRVYDSAAGTAGGDDPATNRDVPFAVGGRLWTLRFESRPWLDPRAESQAAPGVLGVGVVLSGLLFTVMRMQAQSEKIAAARADEMTAVVREREARLRAILDAEPECVTTVSPDGPLLEINRAGLAMVEADDLAQVVGRPLADLVHPDDRAAFKALHRRVVDGETGTLTFRVVGLRGTPRWVDTISVPLRDAAGAVESVLSVTRDVTERHRAEEDLRASEERYRQIVEIASEGVWKIDVDDRTVFVNQRWAQLLGYEPHEMLGRPAPEFLHPDDVALVRDKLARRRLGISEQYDARFVRKDGGTLWALLSARPLYDRDGRYAGALSMVTDITARKRAEAAYQEAQSLVQSIVEHSPAMFFVKDAADLRFVLFNRAGEEMLGFRRDELIGKTVYDVFPQEEADAFTATDRQVLAEGHLVETPEEAAKTRHRGIRYFRTLKAPIFDEHGRPRYLLGVSEDITERRALEEQLRHAQKMDAVGTLAGGLAHDFNNILACIIGFGELARADSAGNEGALDSIARLLEASQRGKRLVEQLLAFSHERAPVREVVDPGVVVAGTLALVRPTLPSGVTVRATIAADLPPILADATELHQLIVNLVTNAAQATPNDGPVDVDVAAVDAGGGPHGAPGGGRCLRIVVRDHGTGMDPATVDRIFDPFFTTKELGRGAGLGLAVVHGIVKRHRGVVRVESTPGRGTRFEVELPVEPGLALPATVATEELAPRGRGERVLFVDDEAPLADLGRRALESFGYRVTALTDPADALRVFRARPGQFDVLVTDQMMPALTGTDLAAELLRIRPGLPVVVVTGFGRNLSPDAVRALGVREIVSKPSSVQALAHAVHRALAAREERAVADRPSATA